MTNSAPLGVPQPRAPITFELPLRGSNEDHLELFETAGESVGTAFGDRVAAHFRLALRLGLKDADVGQFLEAMAAAGLHDGMAVMAAHFARCGVKRDAPIGAGFVRIARGDMELTFEDLRRRGYRGNQVARFRVCSWRAFKLAIREASITRAH